MTDHVCDICILANPNTEQRTTFVFTRQLLPTRARPHRSQHATETYVHVTYHPTATGMPYSIPHADIHIT